MPRYLSQHTLACLTRQGAAELVRRIHGAAAFSTNRVLLNLQEGKMLVEYEAPERTAIESWLGEQKIHFDWLMRVELESSDGELRPVV
ncbi:MAG TPA: hypothetical protein VHX11_08080 [Acidobacteriaceae bacterium]|jgi:hypothetical protein|nr:hypothetical protein [Acidobacteriaceae bacterium]